jgi:CHAT domain-containing protein
MENKEFGAKLLKIMFNNDSKIAETISQIYTSGVLEEYTPCQMYKSKSGRYCTLEEVWEDVVFAEELKAKAKKNAVEITPVAKKHDLEPVAEAPVTPATPAKAIKKLENKDKLIVKGQTYKTFNQKIFEYFRDEKYDGLFKEKQTIVTKDFCDEIGVPAHAFHLFVGNLGLSLINYADRSGKQRSYLYSRFALQSLKVDIINRYCTSKVRTKKITPQDLKFKNKVAIQFFEQFLKIEDEKLVGRNFTSVVREFYKNNDIKDISTAPIVNELRYVIGPKNYSDHYAESIVIKQYLNENYDPSAVATAA